MKKVLREYMKKIGRKGGKVSMGKLSPQELRERGQSAVRNLWKGHNPVPRSRRRITMTPHLRAKKDFPGSLYRNVCPICNAQPFEWCVSLGGNTRTSNPHAGRETPPEKTRPRIK